MHFLRREGRLFIRIFPHKPVSGKPLETRMGKGKGEPEFWCAVVKPGTVMFEVSGCDEITAKRALARVAHKMPVQTRFLARRRAVA
jgi:large subunit ribosomal protein L16